MAGRVDVGTRLGAFEVLALVGAGGMGEVYRARDTRLDRTVAIKVLHDDGVDATLGRRLERFRQEARAIARITHPNICTLHDVCQEGQTTFLVMEFVEGTTLARRLEEGPLPLPLALKIAVQVADALDHAHHQGVIHRDLKPSNIMLSRDRVKLLDFGLAKLMEPDERATVLAGTATHLTEAHTIVGTAAYMAPEQIDGRPVDARSDIFSFGIVFYEMLAGRRPFAGDSRMSVLASIVAAEPPPLALPPAGASPSVERVVRRCLAKDPEERWQTARDLVAELRWIAESGAAGDLAAASATSRRRERVAAAIAIVLGLALAGALLVIVRLQPTAEHPPAVTRFTVPAPDDAVIASMGVGGSPVVVSPDGRHIAFLATRPGEERRLYLRSLDAINSRALPGTTDARHPFWSPDSASIAFHSNGKLQRISIAGGDPQTICDAVAVGGGTWSRDGVILFTAGFERAAVHRVSSSGGTPVPVTRLAAHEAAHLWPSFLPDGRHFLLEIIASERSGIYVFSLDSDERKLLVPSDTSAGDFLSIPLFSPPAYLVFARRGTLMAQSFDVERLEVSGAAFRVADEVDTVGPAAAYSISQNGVLAHWPGGSATTQLTWVDRAGRPVGTVGPRGRYGHIAISPDGAHVALNGSGPAAGVWVLDMRRSTIGRIVADTYAFSPVWSPDGSAILFAAVRDTSPNLFLKRLGAPGDAERIVRAPNQHFPTHWAPDGQTFVYNIVGPQTRGDIWIKPASGDGTPTPLTQTRFDESHARISPDSRWVAYQSDDSGRLEVYVTSYPQPGRRWLVSAGGGEHPVWRKDGRELYYVAASRMLTAVPVRAGASFDAGVPSPLFALPGVRVTGLGVGWSYDVAPDGRFLVPTVVDRSTPPITVVMNWPTAVAKR